MQHEEAIQFFSEVIERELGIVYAEHNKFQLQNRLEEISKLMGIATIDELHRMAQKQISGTFRQLLLDVATNNETSFFRDVKIYHATEKAVLSQYLEKNRNSQPLRIWSAACSTGQEPLSLAILIKEFEKKNGLSLQASILATDISDRVLKKAKLGSYSQLEVQRGLSTPTLIKYFDKDGDDRWKANSELLKMIRYDMLNLKTQFSHSTMFDLIFCRNVLIYQTVESKREILARVTQNLKPGGFLALGSGESLLGLSNDFEQKSLEGAILYQKKS